MLTKSVATVISHPRILSRVITRCQRMFLNSSSSSSGGGLRTVGLPDEADVDVPRALQLQYPKVVLVNVVVGNVAVAATASTRRIEIYRIRIRIRMIIMIRCHLHMLLCSHMG
ncbi:hypothetical protein U9M48_042307 [Paspalum notatum var. saurae]|uniref:Uncharacterized protein n=1 Tax=Paspalum notatum var. saurae TaxID=547442 RepID=A0AAQ3UQV6_PASNO